MVGRDLEHRYPDHTPHIGEEILRVENWTAYHPQDSSRVIVDDVSINVRRGEIVGIAGLMGAGRTEFAMSLFGKSYGTRISGKVFKHGKEIHTRTVSEAIEQRHRLRDRGPQDVRPQPDRGHQAQHLDGRAGQARARRPRRRQRGVQGRRTSTARA